MRRSTLAGVGLCILSGVPLSGQTPKNKAVWEPVNFKGDVRLLDVHFNDEQTGWVVGGATEMAGGVILSTKNAGLTWEVQYGDLQSSDRAVSAVGVACPYPSIQVMLALEPA